MDASEIVYNCEHAGHPVSACTVCLPLAIMATLEAAAGTMCWRCKADPHHLDLENCSASPIRKLTAERSGEGGPASAREMYWYEKAQEAWKARDSAVAVNEADLRDLAATKNRADAAEKRIAELELALRWALGEGDEFPTRPPGQGWYWWRTELRRRAKLQARTAARSEGKGK